MHTSNSNAWGGDRWFPKKLIWSNRFLIGLKLSMKDKQTFSKIEVIKKCFALLMEKV